MDFSDCIKFARENPVCFLATVDQGMPRVRALGLWFVDETGFYFQTAASREMVKHIKQFPSVEVCFFKASGMLGHSMRVRGEAEFLDDPALREKVLADRPFLRMFGLTAESPELQLFRIGRGSVVFWNIKAEFAPLELIRFGN